MEVFILQAISEALIDLIRLAEGLATGASPQSPAHPTPPDSATLVNRLQSSLSPQKAGKGLVSVLISNAL